MKITSPTQKPTIKKNVNISPAQSPQGSPVKKDWFDKAEDLVSSKPASLTGAAVSGAIPVVGFFSNILAVQQIVDHGPGDLQTLSNIAAVGAFANLPANAVAISALANNNIPLAIGTLGFSIASTTLAWALAQEVAERRGA